MSEFNPPLEILIEQFQHLPGIGRKTAQRLAFSIVDSDEESVLKFADALINAKKNIHYCPSCYNFSEGGLCSVCNNEEKDRSVICVVEDAKVLMAIERVKGANRYNGLYHVLHGVISPLDGIGPEQLKIKELLERVQSEDLKEVIIATNPSVEGEATAMYISKLLKPFGLKITRLAFGIPAGGDLEYTDDMTLLYALQGRREL